MTSFANIQYFKENKYITFKFLVRIIQLFTKLYNLH